ncbi:MAG: hypothetical protein EZS28_033758, partial [Streblomastix strix]
MSTGNIVDGLFSDELKKQLQLEIQSELNPLSKFDHTEVQQLIISMLEAQKPKNEITKALEKFLGKEGAQDLANFIFDVLVQKFALPSKLEANKLIEQKENTKASELCTIYVNMEEQFPMQDYYDCVTCGLTSGMGCCAQCVKTCHEGHNVSFSGFKSCFCDCSTTILDCKNIKTSCQGDTLKDIYQPCCSCKQCHLYNICLSCAKTCHKDHGWEYSKPKKFVCECGNICKIPSDLKEKDQKVQKLPVLPKESSKAQQTSKINIRIKNW